MTLGIGHSLPRSRGDFRRGFFACGHTYPHPVRFRPPRLRRTDRRERPGFHPIENFFFRHGACLYWELMKPSLHNAPHDTSPAHVGEDAAYRPDSASIIHTVANRRDTAASLLDRERAQREQVERTNVGLLLHSLHEIADDRIPDGKRRLVREPEVQRAIAVLRRFSLLYPEAKLEQVLEHCERTAAQDADIAAHLIDPLQLRHVLTFHEGIPHEELTSTELFELDRAIEDGPESAIVGWFAKIGPRSAALPKATTAYLRSVFERACRAGTSAPLLDALSFEVAVLTLRIQGVIGFEDLRLFFSLLKQSAGERIPGLEGYLEAGETNHALVQHRTAGNSDSAEYFQRMAKDFDHTRLPTLEQKAINTAAGRTTPMHAPDKPAITAARPVPRRGLLANLRGLGQAILARG